MNLSIRKKKKFFEKEIEKLTPPENKNWNWGKNKGKYKETFSGDFIRYIFPYLLSSMRRYNIQTNEISMLDIGCGWAPMAIPFLINYKNMNEEIVHNNSNYLGIDIREDAIDWLKKAYEDYSFIRFQLHNSNKDADYINAAQNQSKTFSASNGQETEFNIPKGFCHNIQWSSSVFTHLTPQACFQALQSIKKCCSNTGLQINTWLIIDNESSYALNAGVADRSLPIDCGEYLTYSKSNPLICTAYKMDVIEKIYCEAGLTILEIDRGSWRGPFYNNAANHYQDIIISKIKN